MGELIRLKWKGSELTPKPIFLPLSKSINNRLLIMRALSGGKVDIEGESSAEDVQYLKRAIHSDSPELYMGDGGTAIRFGLAWAAITPGVRTITGSERLMQRPIADLVDDLNRIGADIEYTEKKGFAPLVVKGKELRGGELAPRGNTSSQFISALLLIAPYCREGLVLNLSSDQVSLPYISITVALLKLAGADVNESENQIRVAPGGYKPCSIAVEPDWSGASYFYAWQALARFPKIELAALDNHSIQGDRNGVKPFRDFGVTEDFEPSSLVLKPGKRNLPSEINFLDSPDLAQTFAACAAGLRHRLKLTGLQTLRVKETDRIAALQAELAKCGVTCQSGADFIALTAFEPPQGIPRIKTYRDHRMAMAFAPLVIQLGEIEIEDPDVVAKSFPNYWEEVAKLGVEITKI